MGMNPTLTDTGLGALLAACHRGEAASQRVLYNKYYARAHSIAVHYGGSSDEVEDIVQEAFIKLFAGLRQRPFEGDFYRYFRRLVANQSIDYYRRRTRRRRLLTRWWPTATPVATNQGEVDLERNDVVHFLRQLSPAYRMVFSLYVLEGYGHAEIAERLGISVGTSKSNLFKARKKLQALAGPYYNLTEPNRHE